MSINEDKDVCRSNVSTLEDEIVEHAVVTEIANVIHLNFLQEQFYKNTRLIVFKI